MSVAGAPTVRPGCRTLKSAAIFWGRKALLVELRKQRRIGYTDLTLGAVLGRETAQNRLEDPFCRVLDVLRRDVLGMLCRGELEAYGFVEGDDPSAERKLIHKGRWRVLRPDFDSCTAEGVGIELADIIVRPPVFARTSDSNTSAGPVDLEGPVAPVSPVNGADIKPLNVIVQPIVAALPAGADFLTELSDQSGPEARVGRADDADTHPVDVIVQPNVPAEITIADTPANRTKQDMPNDRLSVTDRAETDPVDVAVIRPVVLAPSSDAELSAGSADGDSPADLMGQGDRPSHAVSLSPTTAAAGSEDVRRALVLSVQDRTLKLESGFVHLTDTSFQIIRLLAEQTSKGVRIISYKDIRELYGLDTAPGTLRSNVSRLRSALREAGLRAMDGSDAIRTHYLRGYSLELDPTGIHIEQASRLRH